MAPHTCAPITVFDLPQVYQKPDFLALRKVLELMRCHTDTWDAASIDTAQVTTIDENGLTDYLTRLISSPLTWLDSDDEREMIWEAASQRLCERSGRWAMSDIYRDFKVPISKEELCAISLKEPALVEDQLGHKTWLASLLLSKNMYNLFHIHLSSVTVKDEKPSGDISILELGAGTGLCGLTAAAILKSKVNVVLTDLPEIVPNLLFNISRNKTLLSPAKVDARVLDWSKVGHSKQDLETFDHIIAADSIYAPEHVKWLCHAIALHLKDEVSSRVFLCLPVRPDSPAVHQSLRNELYALEFSMIATHEYIGVEDWYVQGERKQVACWASVWSRKSRDGDVDQSH